MLLCMRLPQPLHGCLTRVLQVFPAPHPRNVLAPSSAAERVPAGLLQPVPGRCRGPPYNSLTTQERGAQRVLAACAALQPPPAPVARTPKAGGPDSAPATPRHPSGLCLGASGTVLCRGTLCLTSTTPWHPDTPYAAGSACHPTAPHSVLVVVAGPGTRSAGGFCARSTQRGLHLVRCCWGGPALGVTKHSTDRHVPGQGGSGDRAGAPRGHTARCWQCKALPAAAPACRGAQVQAAQGTMHTHPNTRTPCWLGCTDTWLHRRTHRGGQRRAHTHTKPQTDGWTQRYTSTCADRRTGTHTDTYTESQTH